MASTFAPSIEVSVDERTGSIRAAYVRIRAGKVAETREISEGQVNADYDADGALLGIELLAPCEVEILDQLAADEPEPVKRFLCGVPPRQLVPT